MTSKTTCQKSPHTTKELAKSSHKRQMHGPTWKGTLWSARVGASPTASWPTVLMLFWSEVPPQLHNGWQHVATLQNHVPGAWSSRNAWIHVVSVWFCAVSVWLTCRVPNASRDWWHCPVAQNPVCWICTWGDCKWGSSSWSMESGGDSGSGGMQ